MQSFCRVVYCQAQLRNTLKTALVVERIYEMVEAYFPSTERLKMGQMIWYAVDEAEKDGYGKSLQHSKLRPVILDILNETDIEDVLQGVRKRERQKKVTVRLFRQSYEQKGVLTHKRIICEKHFLEGKSIEQQRERPTTHLRR